jgi:hypothetical protein
LEFGHRIECPMVAIQGDYVLPPPRLCPLGVLSTV